MVPADYGVDGCWYGLRLKPEAYNRLPVGRPAGLVLLHDRSDGRRHQHQQLQRRRRGAQVREQDQPGGGWLQQDPPRHGLPDVPAGRRVPDLRRGHVAGRWRRPGAGPGLRERSPGAGVRERQRRYHRRRAHPAIPAGRAGSRALVGGPSPDGPDSLSAVHRRHYVWQWKGGAPAGTATETFRDLYPLPASELTANPNLVQNPGY